MGADRASEADEEVCQDTRMTREDLQGRPERLSKLESSGEAGMV